MSEQNRAARETRLFGECVFDGKVLRVERDTVLTGGGTESVREVIRHKGAVCVIPLDSDGCIICERQFRYAVDDFVFEIPAGKLDYVGEDPESAARRELSEETGYSAGRLIYLGLYLGSPAILEERIHMYAALELVPGETHRDSDEFLEIIRIPLDEAVQMVTSGQVPDGKTQVAILRLSHMVEHGDI